MEHPWIIIQASSRFGTHVTHTPHFLHAAFLSVTHFRVGLRLFVGDTGALTVELSR